MDDETRNAFYELGSEMRTGFNLVHTQFAEVRAYTAELRSSIAELRTSIAETRASIVELRLDIADIKSQQVNLFDAFAELRQDYLTHGHPDTSDPNAA
jgi:signal transduction histidine kinase